jgi:hypothetical protein
MHNYIYSLIILIFLISSCKPTAKLSTDFKVVEVPVVIENDTISTYELRFYNIKSSLNTGQVMFENFGKWDQKLEGRYQENIPQLVWDRVTLIPTADMYFTVASSGAESQTEYFSSVQVINRNGEHCFAPDHPLRDFWIRYFSEKIKTLGNPKTFFKVYNEDRR